MSKPIDLYYLAPSAPCRSTMLLARYLNLDTNLKAVNIFNGENKTAEYTMMNPMQSVPTIDDDGFILWESRAILAYFVNAYGQDDSLYPADPKLRAKVDQMLYFDSDTLSARMVNYFAPIIRLGQKPDPERREKLEEALGMLEILLIDKEWAAGSQMTIADFSLIANVSTTEAMGFVVTKYPNLAAWYQRAKDALLSHGYQDVNQKGVDIFAAFYKSKVETN